MLKKVNNGTNYIKWIFQCCPQMKQNIQKNLWFHDSVHKVYENDKQKKKYLIRQNIRNGNPALYKKYSANKILSHNVLSIYIFLLTTNTKRHNI